MPGRRPKPSATKTLNGNPGKRAINRNEPHFTGTPTCPKHLNRAAKAEWKRLADDLTANGLLTNADRSALAAYCAAYARWAEAEQNIDKFGTVIKSPKSGFPIQNPYVGIANTSLGIMRQFLIEFGLTPASRSRIHVTPAGAISDEAFDQFMSGLGADDLEVGTLDEPTQPEAELL